MLHWSFLVRNQCLLREKEKENKSLLRLVLLLQGHFCPCSSFTLERLSPFPDGFDVTHSKHYWSNETVAIQHLDNIMILYFEAMREELGLPEDQKCLLIYVFKAQTLDKYR